MTPERYRRLGEVFSGAVEREGDERVAWLDAACAGDGELRAEVEELLAADAADAMLDRPAMDAAAVELAQNQRGLRPGAAFGPFVIERLLGAGGMSQVYLARDERTQERVALKLLPRALLYDPLRARRFQKETAALRTLAHPDIVAARDAGEVDGAPYLAMEFIEGETLRERLARGRPSEDDKWRWARAIAVAVAAAHKAGVIHRDLKPENIMIDPAGQPKVLDFGLARLARRTGAPASATTLTRTGWLVGTVRYMSPEQARGRPVDARSDVFSLGALFHELWTGRPAFDGANDLEVLAAVTNGAPPPLPAGAPTVIARALEKDPARRPAHAGEVAEALTRPSSKGTLLWWGAVAAVLVLGALFWSWPRGAAAWREGDRARVSIAHDPALETVVRVQLAQSPFLVVGEPATVVISAREGWLEARRDGARLARVALREGAWGEACVELRRALGEGAATLEAFARTPGQNLTESREALAAFARGDARRAVEWDPEFALAWLAVDPARAYEHRLRAAERDRRRIGHVYHERVTGDLEEAILNAEAWRETYPQDPEAALALEELMVAIGRKPRRGPPVDWARLARECSPAPEGLRRGELARALPLMALCGDAARAQRLLDELRRDFPRDTRIHKIWGPVTEAAILRARGRRAEMEQALGRANDAATEGLAGWLRSLR